MSEDVAYNKRQASYHATRHEQHMKDAKAAKEMQESENKKIEAECEESIERIRGRIKEQATKQAAIDSTQRAEKERRLKEEQRLDHARREREDRLEEERLARLEQELRRVDKLRTEQHRERIEQREKEAQEWNARPKGERRLEQERMDRSVSIGTLIADAQARNDDRGIGERGHLEPGRSARPVTLPLRQIEMGGDRQLNQTRSPNGRDREVITTNSSVRGHVSKQAPTSVSPQFPRYF